MSTPFEAIIGLEIHVQLWTRSKLFCACRNAYGAPPNSLTCPVCLGLPGALPVLNAEAVRMALALGLAVGAEIRPRSAFYRKQYFYPDLPKGYQISQYEAPICEYGWIEIAASEGKRRVRIRRAHLEEDAGKSVHIAGMNGSRVDLNRAGTPLLEIVTEPDLRSSDEVVAYLKGLRDVLMYLEVCDGNMDEGSFRCEPNLSLRPLGQKEFGTKVELKNINSFKFVKDAVEYEIKRQTKVLNEGGKINQETRLWNLERGETAVMRSKEEAHDYRYFPDPDLLPLDITPAMLEQVRATLPELPEAKRARYTDKYALSVYDASSLTATREMADFFEAALNDVPNQAKMCANWLIGEVSAQLNRDGLDIAQCPITPQQLGSMLKRIADGTISNAGAKEVFRTMWSEGGDADAIIEAKGLKQLSDAGAIEKIVDEIIAANPAQVAEYRSGKEKVFGFFVGLAMKASKGKANPAQLNDVLRKKLSG